MISATLLALVAAAAPPSPTSAGVFLKASAAAAPSCRTTKVDANTVRAGLFSPDSEQCPVAEIGDERIALRDLAQALEAGHLARSPRASAPAKRPDMDFAPALDRLIAARLLVLEAREMRLDAEPSFRSAVDDFAASRLRQALLDEAAARAKPDAAEVERLYRDAVREWKLKSILLEKEDTAKAFAAELKKAGNASFDALVKQWVDGKKGRGGGAADFVPRKMMLPELVSALSGAKPGVPIGPVKVPNGWVMLRVDGVRYPKDGEARQEARAQSLARTQRQAVRRYYLSLVEKYAVVDQKLLKALDLEKDGEKGFEALLKDARPLATIRGEKPLTVADLTREVSQKFFHGLDGPIREHRVNREKTDTFERLLGNRLFAKEAAARKLDADPTHRRLVAEFERSRLFDTFVGTVIVPDVKVTEADAIGYYEKHKGELTTPEMFKLDGFAFATTAEAQTALNKLKGGTDFPWLRQTAPGQLPPEKRSFQLDGQTTLSVNGLPKALVSALTGAHSGEYRLWAAKPDEVWVIRVVEQQAPRAQPYADARETIAKRLWNERLTAAIDDYAGKLRKAQKVDVLITRVTL